MVDLKPVIATDIEYKVGQIIQLDNGRFFADYGEEVKQPPPFQIVGVATKQDWIDWVISRGAPLKHQEPDPECNHFFFISID